MSITGNGVRVKCVKSLPRGQPETVADVPQSLRTHVEPSARLLVVRVLRFSYWGLRRRWELRNDLLR